MAMMNGTCDHLWKTTTEELVKPSLLASVDWKSGISTAGRFLLFTLTFILFVILLPVIAVVTLLFSLYRFVLTAMIRIQEGEDVCIVDGDDSMWLQDASENRSIINILLIFRGNPDINRIRKLFLQRLVTAVDNDNNNNNGEMLFPKLQQCASRIYRRHAWKYENKFSIDDHVVMHSTHLPEAKIDAEKMIGDICSQPLPEGKSAWQVVVITSKKHKENEAEEKSERFHILFRVHHSLADGISLIRMLMYNLVDKSPPRVQSVRFCARDRFWRSAMAFLAGPLLLLERFTWRADQHILHGPQLSGDKRVSWSDPIDLNLIKQIRKATGSTVNDVLVCCLTGAFSEYFKTHTSEGCMADTIKAYVPVDIRPASFQTPTMTNKFALVILGLPVSEEDPLARLHATKRRMDLIKKSPEPIVNAMTVTYGMNHLPNWITKNVFDWLSSKCTMVLSNVPGPQSKMTIDGNAMDGVIFWPPQRGNIGLGVSIFSYAGYIRVGVLSDKVLLTEPRLVIDEFPKQVQQLANSLKID